mmetsp:Transcript_48300/g.127879  ORF Transcript_48300/g.127879 Transcript_48300/m.127879 type:complete len:245 (-) Transcript_48300:597-1331(-)
MRNISADKKNKGFSAPAGRLPKNISYSKTYDNGVRNLQQELQARTIKSHQCDAVGAVQPRSASRRTQQSPQFVPSCRARGIRMQSRPSMQRLLARLAALSAQKAAPSGKLRGIELVVADARTMAHSAMNLVDAFSRLLEVGTDLGIRGRRTLFASQGIPRAQQRMSPLNRGVVLTPEELQARSTLQSVLCGRLTDNFLSGWIHAPKEPRLRNLSRVTMCAHLASRCHFSGTFPHRPPSQLWAPP